MWVLLVYGGLVLLVGVCFFVLGWAECHWRNKGPN